MITMNWDCVGYYCLMSLLLSLITLLSTESTEGNPRLDYVVAVLFFWPIVLLMLSVKGIWELSKVLFLEE